jgi:hypothetical protein
VQWSDLPLKPTPRMLRQFALLWILFFGALAVASWYRGADSVRTLILGSVAVAGFVGYIAPAAIRPIFVAWLVLAFPIGWAVSRLVLGVLFFLVFTPVALLFRLIGRDVLRLTRSSGDSYWSPKEIRGDATGYFRQF